MRFGKQTFNAQRSTFNIQLSVFRVNAKALLIVGHGSTVTGTSSFDRLSTRIFLIPCGRAFYAWPPCSGDVAPESGSIPFRFVVTNQVMFCVMNPFLGDHQKSALHVRELDIFSSADLFRMFRKSPS
jgi:hypothetical protein